MIGRSHENNHFMVIIAAEEIIDISTLFFIYFFEIPLCTRRACGSSRHASRGVQNNTRRQTYPFAKDVHPIERDREVISTVRFIWKLREQSAVHPVKTYYEVLHDSFPFPQQFVKEDLYASASLLVVQQVRTFQG